MGETLVTERAISRLTGIFGLLALALAAIGLYAVMSYNVTGRTNDSVSACPSVRNPARS